MGKRSNHKRIKKYIERWEDKNTTYQNLEDRAKAGFRGKFIAMNVYIKKETKNKDKIRA